MSSLLAQARLQSICNGTTQRQAQENSPAGRAKEAERQQVHNSWFQQPQQQVAPQSQQRAPQPTQQQVSQQQAAQARRVSEARNSLKPVQTLTKK